MQDGAPIPVMSASLFGNELVFPRHLIVVFVGSWRRDEIVEGVAAGRGGWGLSLVFFLRILTQSRYHMCVLENAILVQILEG
jgi:hypothetical protein